MKTNNPGVLLLKSQQIKELLSMKETITIIENSFLFYAQKKSRMPPKLYLDLPEYSGDFRAMPAFCKSENAAGLKWVNSHPRNHDKQIPTVMALLVLNDPETAIPKAILEAGYLTAMRTGASGGVAVRHLSNPAASVAAFVGAGHQALFQAEAVLCERDIKEIRFFDPSTASKANFLSGLTAIFSGKLFECNSVEECVKEADIITTTTPSKSPVVHHKWVSPGTHINAMGADAAGKQELDPLLLKSGLLVVDDLGQASHSGEINKPLSDQFLLESDIYGNLGDIISGKLQGRQTSDQITLFDSTGLAIHDVSTGAWIVKKAIKLGIGSFFDFGILSTNATLKN